MVNDYIGIAAAGPRPALSHHVPADSLCSLTVMYMHEYILTLDREIELFWRGKAFASVLFLLNRYLQLFGVVWAGIGSIALYTDNSRVSVQPSATIRVIIDEHDRGVD